KTIIQDRTIYEDAYIFEPNLYSMGLMSDRDFENYRSLFELMQRVTTPPDILIYLRSSIPHSVKQIPNRAREYDNSISNDYSSKLNERYENRIKDYDKGKLLIIPVDDLDVVSNPEDLGFIIEKIDAELYGLF